MKVKEAIILAGGFGTRLKPIVDGIPKPMAPINEIPFLQFLLDYLARYGITHAILSVGYKWDVIREHFGDSYGSIRLSYAVEKEPLGTGGGIKLATEQLEGHYTFILNGDTFFNVNLKDLSEFFLAHQADITLTVKRMYNFFRYGTVQLDICKIVGFMEKKPVKTGLINGGVYIARKSIFEGYDLPQKFSFETDFLEKHFKQLKACAMQCNDYFVDIGVPADYEKALHELPGMKF